MDQTYCDKRVQELECELDTLTADIPQMVCRLKQNQTNDSVIKYLEHGDIEMAMNIAHIIYDRNEFFKEEDNENSPRISDDDIQMIDNICEIRSQISMYKYVLRDTEWKHFEGDLIITDPCYLMPDGVFGERWNGLWDDLEEMLETKGFIRDTICGDWSCTVFDTDFKNPIGKFCADGGMVCVALLEDVLKFNPKFDYHLNREWTTAWLKDFHGDIRMTVSEDHYEYDGEDYTDHLVRIEGRGNINFTTSQTGL